MIALYFIAGAGLVILTILVIFSSKFTLAKKVFYVIIFLILAYFVVVMAGYYKHGFKIRF